MPIKHHEDCDVYQATLASEGPYGDPTITPSDYSCLPDCKEDEGEN